MLRKFLVVGPALYANERCVVFKECFYSPRGIVDIQQMSWLRP